MYRVYSQKVRQTALFALDIRGSGLYNRFGIVYAVLGICFGFSVSLITGVKAGGMRFTPYGVFARYELGIARFLFMRKIE